MKDKKTVISDNKELLQDLSKLFKDKDSLTVMTCMIYLIILAMKKSSVSRGIFLSLMNEAWDNFNEELIDFSVDDV